VAFTLAAVLLLAVVPAAAVPPSSREARDPVADGHVYPRNDIVRIRVTNAPTVRLRLDTRQGANPATDPAWRNVRGTRLIWMVDIDEDPAPEYRVGIASTTGGPSVPEVIDLATGAPMCRPQFTFSHGNRYVLSFPWACIGSPGWVEARANYRYRPLHGGERFDVAPNAGFTAPVVYPFPI
jgi:hypothetical protein